MQRKERGHLGFPRTNRELLHQPLLPEGSSRATWRGLWVPRVLRGDRLHGRLLRRRFQARRRTFGILAEISLYREVSNARQRKDCPRLARVLIQERDVSGFFCSPSPVSEKRAFNSQSGRTPQEESRSRLR